MDAVVKFYDESDGEYSVWLRYILNSCREKVF